jgi:hypothetical protein
MPINNAFTRWLARMIDGWADRLIDRRYPDFVIGDKSDPYLRRWWVIPRNPFGNIYLHEFHKDDDDRACHCHPWISVSLSLRGRMDEIYLERADGIVIERKRHVEPGAMLFRRAAFAHRMIVPEPGARTLFLTGPSIRRWGFWCPNGWVYWRDFVDARDSGKVGKGCE